MHHRAALNQEGKVEFQVVDDDGTWGTGFFGILGSRAASLLNYSKSPTNGSAFSAIQLRTFASKKRAVFDYHHHTKL